MTLFEQDVHGEPFELVPTRSCYCQEVFGTQPKSTIPEWDCKWEWNAVGGCSSVTSEHIYKQCALPKNVQFYMQNHSIVAVSL